MPQCGGYYILYVFVLQSIFLFMVGAYLTWIILRCMGVCWIILKSHIGRGASVINQDYPMVGGVHLVDFLIPRPPCP